MSMTVEECAGPRAARPVPDIPTNVLEQFSLKGRVCVVTGASSGIGLSVVEGFAEAGGDVALWYNSNPSAIEHAERLAKQHGVRAKAYQCDVADPAAVQKAMQQTENDFGGIHVFVANGGIGVSKGLLESSLEEYHKQMDINLHGVAYCAKYVGEVFKKQGKGSFIATSSMSARIVNVPVDQPVYNATKAAVTHLCKSLAVEWQLFARVNIVSPGFFDTNMGASPPVLAEAHRMAALGRQGHVKEIKALYLYLASDASSFVTGSDMLIDGGYTLP